MRVSFRKICSELHLWLGISSSIVVTLVCLTGALYAFKDEITEMSEPWRFVDEKDEAMILPSEAIARSIQCLEDTIVTAITYGEASDAIRVDRNVWGSQSTTVWLDPYSGDIIKIVKKDADSFDFFAWVLRGHMSLWLPRNIGRPIVGYCVLMFLITLLTGLFHWAPLKMSLHSVKRMFTWRSANWTSFNFMLHTVAGTYALLPLLALCFTGLMYALSWWTALMYLTVSCGRDIEPYQLPSSIVAETSTKPVFDELFRRLRAEEPQAKTFYFALPSDSLGCIRVSIVHERGSYYKTDNRFFDQYDLHELEGIGPYAGRYSQKDAADKMMRMNLEIHDGRMWGIWGKIMMFVASLIGASLPVTGVIIFIRRKMQRK